MSLEDDLELINLPTGTDVAYKVIQMWIGEKPVMIFGGNFDQHPDILKSFLEERGISFSTIRSIKDRSQIPSLGGEGNKYRVAGMGYNYIYTNTRNFTLPTGGSGHYDSDANPEHSAIFERRMIKDGWTL